MKTFLATTGNGLARAAQTANAQWQVETLLDGQGITCIAADPHHSGVVYAGTRMHGVLCSQDNGSTWKPAGLDGYHIKAVSVSRIQPNTMYAGTKPACVFVSHDGGRRWTELASFRSIFSRRFWFSPAESPFTAYVQGIALSPTDPNLIVVGIEAGAVVRTTDGGKTWHDHRRGALRDCHSITFHNTNSSYVYEGGGTGAGASISRNGGDTWTQNKQGLDRHYGWACAADPLDPELCYASISPSPMKAHSEGNAQAYIFRAQPDGGWQKLQGGLPQPLNYMPYALVTAPSEPRTIYAGLSNGDVWHSPDCGDSWTRLPMNLHRIQHSMILLP